MKKINFNATIIEASAGTGKTRLLTKEILNILKNQPFEFLKKIIAITFSEKAAIEMKTRLFTKIFQSIHPHLNEEEKIKLENTLLKMRISTIHSFCQYILKRFSFFIGIDPFFKIIDDRESGVIFRNAIGKFLNSPSGKEYFYEIAKEFKLTTFKRLLFEMEKAHPHIFVGKSIASLTEKLSWIFQHISKIHFDLKSEISSVDFDDLEKLTFKILSENPNSLVVLEDFDERINFIFIDEFQDTNLLQWKIINKLIEEWLAGYGAKAELGEKFGIFIVGDRKQSIYKFRGAESEIFDDAKKTLKGYFKERNLLKNYRSSKVIINFVNRIFQDISPWSYQKLEVGEENKEIPSEIKIKLFTCETRKPEENEKLKQLEYKWVCSQIIKIITDKKSVVENGSIRPITFRDIAILLRKRNDRNFKLLEKTLMEFNIPFVIIGGVGFYQEPEIIFLLSLLFSLIEPSDKLAFWNLKNSIYKINENKMKKWRKYLDEEEITLIIEKILKEINFWKNLSIQQKANVEKFLVILQRQSNLPYFQIINNFRELSFNFEEPKADIFSIHQNAVKILTVHGAKGLEFPAVFLINLEDGKVEMRNKIIYRKEDESPFPYSYVISTEAEKDEKEYFRNTLREEEKRILYVALTRASQYLFISGIKREKNLWVQLIVKSVNESEIDTSFSLPEIPISHISIPEKREEKYIIPEEFLILTSYSHEREKEIVSYEEMIMGKMVHQLLYELSTGKLKFERESFEKRTNFLLEKERGNVETGKKIMRIFEIIERDEKLRYIILPKEGREEYAEFPFITGRENKIYEGVIDRMIVEDDTVKIYDYKIYGENTELFKEQMDIYETGIRGIFKGKKIEKYIISLKTGKVLSLP